MEVTIKGRHFNKERRSIIVDLANWCGHKLLNPQLNKYVNLTIHIISPATYHKCGTYAQTDFYDYDKSKPRNFIITMTSRYGILRSSAILAHEMVHVNQYASGTLGFCKKTNLTKWNGQLYDESKYSYWDLPWEIEAFGREKGLVYQWAKERGYDETAHWFKSLF